MWGPISFRPNLRAICKLIHTEPRNPPLGSERKMGAHVRSSLHPLIDERDLSMDRISKQNGI
jgi:hypothetical protein